MTTLWILEKIEQKYGTLEQVSIIVRQGGGISVTSNIMMEIIKK